MSVGIINGNTAGLYIITATITPASVATITAAEQSFTLTGKGILARDNVIAVIPPSEVAGVSLTYARVTGANTVAIKFVNPTAGSVTPPSGAYTFVIGRTDGLLPAQIVAD
jgi:hypothetical protein